MQHPRRAAKKEATSSPKGNRRTASEQPRETPTSVPGVTDSFESMRSTPGSVPSNAGSLWFIVPTVIPEPSATTAFHGGLRRVPSFGTDAELLSVSTRTSSCVVRSAIKPSENAVPVVYYAPQSYRYQLSNDSSNINIPQMMVLSRPTATVVGAGVTVRVVDGVTSSGIAGATVVFVTSVKFRTGAEGTTDSTGSCTLVLPTSAVAEELYVYPAHSYWSFMSRNTPAPRNHHQPLVVPLTPLSVQAQMGDAIHHYYKRGAGKKEGAGSNVVVGIIDTGVGPHKDLTVVGGANFIDGEDPTDVEDPRGHGTHVAGIIASHLGVAPAAKIRSYRVFSKNIGLDATNSDIFEAIIQAVDDGCDLINLSLGGPAQDASFPRAVEYAINHGVAVFSANGNAGRRPVYYPAACAGVQAVACLGRKGTYPDDSSAVADVVQPFGSDPNEYVAAFSNIGQETRFVGPGCAVVSTFPHDRLAEMSGTSMACPALVGVAARLLSGNKGILGAARNADRSKAITQLLIDVTVGRGFGSAMQGHGLPLPQQA